MQMRKRDKKISLPIRRHALVTWGRIMLVVAGASLLAAVLISARLLTAGQEQLAIGTEQPPVEDNTAAGQGTGLPSDVLRVGIVAGHAGYDPGAVCPDGWSEADLTMTIAQEVQELLTRKGYHVDLLEEFDSRLTDYRADGLVSIHADSCDVLGASGFKVARVTDSVIPEAEDVLVDCLYQEYEAATELSRHPSSITDNMTSYHAFREIDRYTPGAIIEVGFMSGDRDLLVNRPKVVARGIAAGVVCFLEKRD
jgi:N-acetylmuramoyl-L-alanine amidase